MIRTGVGAPARSTRFKLFAQPAPLAVCHQSRPSSGHKKRERTFLIQSRGNEGPYIPFRDHHVGTAGCKDGRDEGARCPGYGQCMDHYLAGVLDDMIVDNGLDRFAGSVRIDNALGFPANARSVAEPDDMLILG